MNFKSIFVSAALVTMSALASAGPVMTLQLQDDGFGSLAASFQGFESGQLIQFSANQGDTLDVLSVTGTAFGGAGFVISDIWFDGASVTALTANSAISSDFSNWAYSVANLTAGTHTIQVFGSEFQNASFNGLVSITAAVPEPQTYALLLTGVAAMAFVHRRRKSV